MNVSNAHLHFTHFRKRIGNPQIRQILQVCIRAILHPQLWKQYPTCHWFCTELMNSLQNVSHPRLLMDMLIMPYLDFCRSMTQLTTVNAVFSANRCQCLKASVQLPEQKTPQMKLHSWLIPPLRYVWITSGWDSLSKGFEIRLWSATSHSCLTACCY